MLPENLRRLLQSRRLQDGQNLVAAYDALPEKQRQVVNLYAVAAPCPITRTSLPKCLKALDAAPAGTGGQSSSTAYEASLVDDLTRAHLIVAETRQYPYCHPRIMEVVARRLVTAGEFARYAEIVRRHLPLEKNHRGEPVYYRQAEFLREARIGIYLNDPEFVERELARYNNNLYTRREAMTLADLAWKIFDNPFDPAALAEAPAGLALRYLFAKFPHPFPDEAACDLRPTLLALGERLGRDGAGHDSSLLFGQTLLIEQQIVRGEWPQAEESIREGHRLFPKAPAILECEGWLLFLRGRVEEALDVFAAGLREMRKSTRKRKIFFHRGGGFFYLLALIKAQTQARVEEASDLLDLAEVDSFSGRMRTALEYLFNSLKGGKPQLPPLEKLHPRAGSRADSFPVFFSCLCRFWMDRKALRECGPLLAGLHKTAKGHGLTWFAAEIAELLARLEAHERYAGEASAFRAATGAESIVDLVAFKSLWERSLEALLALGAGTGAQDQAGGRGKSRLAWFLEGQSTDPRLVPKEQKLSKGGQWSSGRNIALNRLCDNQYPDFFTEQDRLILAHLKGYKGYHQVWYEFEPRALLELAGHPHLFRHTAGGPVRLEFVRGEPELIARQDKKGGIVLELTPVIKEGDQVLVVEENPSRFRVVEVRPEHLRIAVILGDKGLSMPARAREQAVKVTTAMARLMTVHSDIGVEDESAREIAADSRPYLLIRPHGQGLKVSLIAKPLGLDGPGYAPGAGGSSVIGVINGERIFASRDLAGEKAGARAFLAGSPLLMELDEIDREWRIDDPEACLELLADLERQRDDIVVAWPEGRKMRVAAVAGPEALSLKIRSGHDWFAIDGQLRIDAERVLSIRQLLDLASGAPGRFLAMGEGEFLALTGELRKRLDDLKAFTQLHGRELRIHPLAAQALAGFLDEAGRVEADAKWRRHRERLQKIEEFVPAVPTTLQAELRDYQVEGFSWLARLAHLGMGACLADDMGLGKTVQALALLLHRAKEGPALVVAPTSVCPNWVEEAGRFAPTLKVMQLGAGNRSQVIDKLRPLDLLVVSYGLLQVGEVADLLAGVAWSTAVLDEAQAIKNFETKRSRGAMKLTAGCRLLTTGTPIENHLGELWNLFRFINPGLLGSLDSFNERFAIPIERQGDPNARKRLRKLIKPFILRRLKSQVLEELPPRTDIVLHVELSGDEQAFYEAIRQKALEVTAEAAGPPGARHLKILAEIMRLRRACCHPRLVMPDSDLAGSKLRLFGDTVAELLEGRHKVLVFSQFVGHLAIVRDYLKAKGIPYQYLDGSTPPRERKKAVDGFQAGEGDIFLISLKAGGTGLNLTAADYVIHLDPWWNPAVEDQASDRAHRIGQERPVTVYRLVTKGTIEEKIVALHHKKRDLADGLLAGTDTAARISTDDLIRLIREEG